jgi:vacuolar-type H+-ATPase subunit F/Vma7
MQSLPFALNLCVFQETPTSAVESAFTEFTEREDIAIVLINQHVRSLVSYIYNIGVS